MLELRQRADVAGVAPIERIVAYAPGGTASIPIAARRSRRMGVGHLEDAGDAAQHGGAAAAFEVFLVLIAGFAEMALAVDHPGQDVQALGLEHLGRLGAAERPDGGGSSGADADIADGQAVRRRHGSALDEKVEGL